MMTEVYSGSVYLGHFVWSVVSYKPKNIVTTALQITNENIGSLSLDFDVEIRYNDVPCFTISAGRSEANSPRILTFNESDWLVILNDEFHKFTDEVFRNTFSFEVEEDDALTLADLLHEEGERHKATEIALTREPENKSLGRICEVCERYVGAHSLNDLAACEAKKSG